MVCWAIRAFPFILVSVDVYSSDGPPMRGSDRFPRAALAVNWRFDTIRRVTINVHRILAEEIRPTSGLSHVSTC